MKVLLKALGIILLAVLSAGATVYMFDNCPERQAKAQKNIEEQIAKYINDNPQLILEKIAKNENFGTAVKSFSMPTDDDLAERIKVYMESTPDAALPAVRNNLSAIVATILENDDFKNAMRANEVLSDDEVEVAENSDEPQENPDQKFLDHWEELSNSDVAPFTGPNDAKVKVVEFFDFACGHCKSLAPIMSQLIKDNPDVKFVFSPLYFISEHSPYAAKVSLAAFAKGKFNEVFDGIMTLPNMNEETINQILVDEGLNVDEIKKMTEEKKIRRGIQKIDSLSQVLGINGVPMVIINGHPFYGRSLEDLQNAINSYK